ncbi:MAG TPA: ATP-binding protein [Chitinophagaceae bacterium]|nr:ATP-binding protein [Chitinophagaceae bacterium]
MLLRFSLENYLSFKDKAFLDFTAGTIKEKLENVFSPFFFEGPNLLKSIGLYGKNSSGKSNLLKGFSFMREFVVNSSKESLGNQSIKVLPFKLSSETDNKASTFEVIFFIGEIKYRYGFSATEKAVQSEWLFQTSRIKESYIFIRAEKDIECDKKFKQELKGKFELLHEVTRTNSLFISVLAQFNMQLGLSIQKWFEDILVAHDEDHYALIDFSAKLMNDAYYNQKLNEIIQHSDFGIDSVEQRIKEIITKKNYSREFLDTFFADNKDYSVRTTHTKYNNDQKPVQKIIFDLLENESIGTQKYFGLFGPILLALTQKRILWIDEIDARLHPILLENIISFFNSKKYNPNGAQIVFTSHNTIPLKKLLRRDQMIFVEKDSFGASCCQSLYAKSPKTRNDASFDKDYLMGKYGAIPKINTQLNLDFLGTETTG